MDRQKRLIGIDLFRGLATFAVVILHTGKGVEVIPARWSLIMDFALFAVPFFLALSFYLSFDKLYSTPDRYPLLSRLSRILIPYFLWSALYLLYRAIKYSLTGDFNKSIELVSDPLSLICFGGASPPLYFIPLLAIGMVLIKLAELPIGKNVSLRILAISCVLATLLYNVLLISGNSYDIITHLAFQPLLVANFPLEKSNSIVRLISVIVASSIRLLPYILAAMMLTHPSAGKFRLNFIKRYPLLWLVVFLVINIFGSHFLPQSFYEIARGYSALIAALSCSLPNLKFNHLIESLGLCSFGIYLNHFFIIEVFQSIAKRIYPDHIYHINTELLVLTSIAILAISWLITLLLMKSKKISKPLFG